MGETVGDKTVAKGEGRILIDHVEKVYDPEGVNVHAVHDCSADIQPGEFVMVVGPSGCGKTTLLNAIAGFDNATGGAIYLDDELIASPDIVQTPGADRMVVFQGGALFPWKTVIDNITYGPVVQGKMSVSEAVNEARGLMQKLSLSQSIEDLYPDNLSSGMKRQVEIIRALINNPKVLLLDEPFRALDDISKSLMHEYLLGVFEMTRKTIFFITHDLGEAVFLADRIFIMTTRPGTFKSVIDVDIPRPRDFKVLASKRFVELREQVKLEIDKESLKAFEAGEREMA
jgi:NitT/TauT family transport system ATP-binding protein